MRFIKPLRLEEVGSGVLYCDISPVSMSVDADYLQGACNVCHSRTLSCARRRIIDLLIDGIGSACIKLRVVAATPVSVNSLEFYFETLLSLCRSYVKIFYANHMRWLGRQTLCTYALFMAEVLPISRLHSGSF